MTGRNELERLVQRRDQTKKRFFDLFQSAGLAGQVLQASSTGSATISGRRVANFVDSDYLGLSKHPLVTRYACHIAKRAGLSTGMPRLLGHDSLSNVLEKELAQLVDQEKALIFPSTTHIALDLLALLAGDGGVIIMDAWAYPISLEGAYAATRYGAQVTHFAHNDPSALEKVLRSYRHIRDKVIVCDGVYSAGGEKAALREFSTLAEQYGAVIYLDDAHGLGILGMESQKNPPYGRGGGGTPLFARVPRGNLLHVASLSKALGVNLAFAAGPEKVMDYLKGASQSLMHSSQPALPVVAAAIGALQVNRTEGDGLREQLAERVNQFITGFKEMEIHPPGNGCFPIQSLYFRSSRLVLQAAVELRQNGIWPLLQLSPMDIPGGGALRFVISAKHTEIEFQRIHDLIHTFENRERTRTLNSYDR